MVSNLWNSISINSKQVVLSSEGPIKSAQKWWHLHRIIIWHYVHDGLDIRRLQILLETMLHRLEEDFSAKLYTDAYQRETLCAASSGMSSFEHSAQEKPFVVEPITAFFNTPRIGTCSFQWWVTFSSQSRSRLAFIWRESGTCNRRSNVREIDHFWGRGILVWGDIVLGIRASLYVIDSGNVSTGLYRNEVLAAHVMFFRVPCVRNSFLWTIMWGHIELTLFVVCWKKMIFAIWSGSRSLWISIL